MTAGQKALRKWTPRIQ